MFSRRPIVAAAAVLAAGLLVATASPAFAAGRTIPTGDAMFALDCDESGEVQGWSVNSTDAALTQIGDGTVITDESCAYQAAYDVTTGISYYVDEIAPDGVGYTLNTFDPATGVSTVVNRFFEGDDTYIDVVSIAIGLDGKAYAIDNNENLFSLSLGTAQVTFIGPVDDFNIFGFAVNPATGGFWIAGDDGLRTIDVTNGAVGAPEFLDFPNGTSVQSLQIDSAGVFWILNYPMAEDPQIELWSTTGTSAANLLSGLLLDEDILRVETSLLIIPAPKPALAATGVELTAPLIAGAGILTLGGALLLIRRRATA